jgi:hypothetical protein
MYDLCVVLRIVLCISPRRRVFALKVGIVGL